MRSTPSGSHASRSRNARGDAPAGQRDQALRELLSWSARRHGRAAAAGPRVGRAADAEHRRGALCCEPPRGAPDCERAVEVGLVSRGGPVIRPACGLPKSDRPARQAVRVCASALAARTGSVGLGPVHCCGGRPPVVEPRCGTIGDAPIGSVPRAARLSAHRAGPPSTAIARSAPVVSQAGWSARRASRTIAIAAIAAAPMPQRRSGCGGGAAGLAQRCTVGVTAEQGLERRRERTTARGR